MCETQPHPPHQYTGCASITFTKTELGYISAATHLSPPPTPPRFYLALPAHSALPAHQARPGPSDCRAHLCKNKGSTERRYKPILAYELPLRQIEDIHMRVLSHHCAVKLRPF